MVLRGFIPVDRKNASGRIAAVEQAVESMKAGNSFMAFRKAHAARTAVFRLLRRACCYGHQGRRAHRPRLRPQRAEKSCPRESLAFIPARPHHIHDPISAADYALEQRKELIQVTRQAIMKGLDPEEWPLEETEAAGGKAAGGRVGKPCYVPVLPNPRTSRAVEVTKSTSVNSTSGAGNPQLAMRSPGFI